MSRIEKTDRMMIERIKENERLILVLPQDEIELDVKGDKEFAHQVALAFQSLLLRKQARQAVSI